MRYLYSLVFLGVGLLLSHGVIALECGDYDFPACQASSMQFSGGFQAVSGYGGFGGGECQATKVPVVFIHGNGDEAINWGAPPTQTATGYPLPEHSVYEAFVASGYNNCELYGLTYLSQSERSLPGFNYHSYSKQKMISEFIDSIKAYTGKDQVDIVAHSLGTSMALSAIERFNQWGSVRRFVNIAGAVKGLQSCLYTGYANPIFPTCAGQNLYDKYMFGLFPSTEALFVSWGRNDWTGKRGSRSMRKAPANNPMTSFYTISAGYQDQIHCSTLLGFPKCVNGALFDYSSNVKAQLDVGIGSLATQLDFNFNDWSITNLMGGDTDGVGHFGSKINTGTIIHNMLATDCTHMTCANGYSGKVD